MDGLKHSDKLITKPPTDDYRKGWERIFKGGQTKTTGKTPKP